MGLSFQTQLIRWLWVKLIDNIFPPAEGGGRKKKFQFILRHDLYIRKRGLYMGIVKAF
ncbi:MAG: hypothetical protein LBR79_01230 [Oscillospiraceae bacterium]|nr:hypothetical protein [Oscillospiraceae bacterium]